MNPSIAPETLRSPVEHDITDRLMRIEQRDLRWNALHQNEEVVLRRDTLGNRVIDLTPHHTDALTDAIHPSSARPQIRQWRKQYVGPDAPESRAVTMLDDGDSEIDALFTNIVEDGRRIVTTPPVPSSVTIMIEADEPPTDTIIDLREPTADIDHLFDGIEVEEPAVRPQPPFAELESAILFEAEMITAGAAAHAEIITSEPVRQATREPAAEKRHRFKRFGTAVAAGVLAVGAMVGGMLAGGSHDKALEASQIETPVQAIEETPVAPPAQAVEAAPFTVDTIDAANLRMVLNGLSECTQLYGDDGCLQAMEYAAFVSQ